MPTKEDLKEKVNSLTDARAKYQACQDVIDLLEKYDKKIIRQINDLERKCERMVKNGVEGKSYYNAFSQLSILRYQILHIKDFRIEFMERLIEIGKTLKTVEQEFKAVAKKIDEENLQENE